MFNGGLADNMVYMPHTSDTHNVGEVLNLQDPNYGITYEEGPFFDNINVAASCAGVGGSINPTWFDDTAPARRRRMKSHKQREMADTSPRRLQNTLRQVSFNPIRRAITPSPTSSDGTILPRADEQVSPDVFLVEECPNGRTACALPDTFADCTNSAEWPINPVTGDIDITFDQIITMDGINACQAATRAELYDMAKIFGYLKKLCDGCMDNFCDRSSLLTRCAIGDNDIRGNPLIREQDVGTNNADVVSIPRYNNKWMDLLSWKMFAYVVVIVIATLLCNLVLMECTFFKTKKERYFADYDDHHKSISISTE